MDLQHGLREPDEFNSRYLAALAKMLRAEGCEPDTATLDQKQDAVNRVIMAAQRAGMPLPGECTGGTPARGGTTE